MSLDFEGFEKDQEIYQNLDNVWDKLWSYIQKVRYIQ